MPGSGDATPFQVEVDQGLTFHQTHYGSYRGRVFTEITPVFLVVTVMWVIVSGECVRLTRIVGVRVVRWFHSVADDDWQINNNL